MKAAIAKVLELIGLHEPLSYPEDQYDDLWVQANPKGSAQQYEFESGAYPYPTPSHMDYEEEYPDMNRNRQTATLDYDATAPRDRPSRPFETALNMPRIPNFADTTSQISAPCEVVIIDIHEFNEVTRVLKELSDQKLVVINLICDALSERQRVLDVISGGTSIINGSAERVGDTTFLFTPSSIRVTSSQEETNPLPQRSERPTIQDNWRRAS